MLFWRQQDTTKQEQQSLHIDIAEILVRKEDEDIEDLLELYNDSIELREDPDALRRALRAGSFEQKDEITAAFPLMGLCGFVADSDEPPYENVGVASGTKYWVLYEGEYLGDCGDGDIFRPIRILKEVKI